MLEQVTLMGLGQVRLHTAFEMNFHYYIRIIILILGRKVKPCRDWLI